MKKTFTDRNVLKEHMRKKLHKRINPENKEYDKFYIVNYLEEDKSWKAIQQEDDRYALPRGNIILFFGACFIYDISVICL